jgi:hypothetical protein
MADFTHDDFIHGRPERLFGASKKPKVLVLWQHSNERLGPNVGYYLYTKRPDLLEHIDYLCGNPRAAQAGRHWIDTDLNRSYRPASQPVGYEEHRAQEILEIIRSRNYDYIVDLHTSVTDVDRFIIIHEDNPTIRAMIGASFENRIVVLPPHIYQVALAGQVNHCMALEYNQDIADEPAVVEQVVHFLEKLIRGLAHEPKPREFFYIDGTVPKSRDPGLHVRNFEWCDDGYYPVLFGTGERSYRQDPTKSYLGFAAKRKETIEL